MTPDELKRLKHQRKQQVLEKVPEETLWRMIATIAIISNWAWSWVETTLDLAKLMQLEETKQLSRKIRELQREKDRYRATIISSRYAQAEAQFVDDFQDAFGDHIDKLHCAVQNAINHDHPDGEYNFKMLLQAVYEAYTAIEVVRLFSDYCKQIMQEYGVTGYTLVDPQISEVQRLLPQFCGDWWKGLPEPCKFTAKILHNEIIKFKLIEQ